MANNTDWLNISQMTGGTGETALSLTALTNTSLEPKTATITARNTQYNVSDTTTVTIQGFQPTLTLSRSTLRFDNTGGTATFTVFSNTDWTINFPQIVHSYSTSAGTGNMEVSVVLAPNTEEISKVETGTVQDKYGINQLYLTIVQETFIAELTVAPDSDITFVNTGSSYVITIDANCNWEIDCPSWITPSVQTGESGTTTVTLSASWNGPNDRNGTVTVYAGSKYVSINAYQPFYIEPYLRVSPTAYTFSYLADAAEFLVDSFPGWSAEVVTTGSSNWGEDTAVETKLEVPANATISITQPGVLINGIVVNASTYTFQQAGTYSMIYPYIGPTGPVIGGNQYVKEIIITDKVENIPARAFSDCPNLTALTVGTGVTTIGDSAFANLPITELFLGPYIETIGRNAFSGCSGLSSITVTAENAPYIYSNTFSGVASGGTLYYPYNADYASWLSCAANRLGYYGWNDAEPQRKFVITYAVTSTTEPTVLHSNRTDSSTLNNLRLTLEDGTEIPNASSYTFSRTGNISVTYNITGDDNVIGGGWTVGHPRTAYSGYFAYAPVVDVKLYEGVKAIGNGAFGDSVSACSLGYAVQKLSGFPANNLIKRIEIPDSVTEIGSNAMGGCYVLPNEFINHSLLDEASKNYWGATIIDYRTPDGLCVKDNVVVALRKDTNGYITIPNTVSAFSSYEIFYRRNDIHTVTFEMGNYVFKEIPAKCFSGSSIEEIVLPLNLTTVGDDAFYYCKSLSSITAYSPQPSITKYTFGYVKSGGTLYYPNGQDYSTWLSGSSHYLGYYNWSGVTFEPDFGFIISTDYLHFPKTGGSENITIAADNANCDWYASNIEPYEICSVYPYASHTYGVKNISFDCYSNQTEIDTPVTSYCHFIVNGQTASTVTIEQEPFAKVLTPKGGEYGSIGLNVTGESFNIEIESPFTWYLIADDSFLTIDGMSSGGPGSYTVQVSFEQNNTGSFRETYLRLMRRSDNTQIKSLLCTQNCYESLTLSGTYIYMGNPVEASDSFKCDLLPLSGKASTPLGFYVSVPRVLYAGNYSSIYMKVQYRSSTNYYPAFDEQVTWQQLSWEYTGNTTYIWWGGQRKKQISGGISGPMYFNYSGVPYAYSSTDPNIKIIGRVDIFNSENNLKHRYIPYKDENGYGCLYDVVTGEYKYGNVIENVIPNILV